MTEFVGEDCGGSNVFTVGSSRADPDKHPRFDGEFRFDIDRKDGEVRLSIGLNKEECEALYEELKEGGHEYPAGVRERVLEAVGFGL